MIPDIAAALAARLGEWADAEGIPIAWENVPFTPPSDGLYLAVHDMPATPRTVDLGLRCRIYSGVYTRLTLWPQPAQAVPMLWPWLIAWLNCSPRGRRLKAGVLHAG